MRVIVKLKTKEEILSLFGEFDPCINNEGHMDHFFGTVFNGSMREETLSKNYYYVCLRGWYWNKKWFDWIKDDLGNLVYGKDDDIMTDIENMIDQIVEDL